MTAAYEDRAAGRGPAGAVVGVVAVVASLFVASCSSGSGPDERTAAGPAGSARATAPTVEPDGEQESDLVDYLVAFQRSLEGRYVARGTITWTRRPVTGSEISETVAYVHARDSGQVLLREGASVTLEAAGEARHCELFGSEVLCGQPDAAPTTAMLVEAARLELEVDYDVRETGGGCFELLGREPLPFGNYGQSSMICFDAETGAESSRVTHAGRRTTTLVIDTLDAEPGGEVFDPRLELVGG